MFGLIIPLSLFTVAACLLIYLYFTKIYRKRRPGEAPVAKGHFLWGNGEEFNKNAVQFLLKCGKDLGDVFTIRLLNQCLTIVMDPHSYEAFSKEKNFDFNPIQEQVNWNVFSFVLKKPKAMVKIAGKTVRGPAMDKAMDNVTTEAGLSKNNNTSDMSKEWSEDGLRSLCRKTIFNAIFYTLFGREDNADFNPTIFCNEFEVYHKYFNYMWLGMPRSWFPAATKALGRLVLQPSSDELLCRDDASEYLKTMVAFMKSNDQNEMDIKAHNLVYLHVNYNTFKVAFWALYHILQQREGFQALRQEIDEILERKRQSNNPDEIILLDQADVEGMKTLDSICLEAFRVSSGVFMVRYVTEDTKFTTSEGKEHIFRKGDRAAIYPPAIHNNPEIFEDPEEYKHDRFKDKKFYRNGREIKNPILSFGSLCPGRRMAMLQLKWYMLAMVNRLDIELLPGEKAEYAVEYYGHEILPPRKDVNVRMRLRPNCRQVQLTV
ncbi:25-hydroxycholesterol 7-alpha-hydroxylase-like [Lingula anatina]|uniref:25-hydroxycholesterol 7-alpha-hydroxylase-like n=1 Tax=Lingula anatina TaxID=7574 RepID=A0A2R2MJX2_LINAN|nr:25-hydroxycholesterol 7-alpha-hydroxylase-like [Lingula anatina]|eukprot:XP_023930362.1 25-hydroxycholesterol 7-alpha-hydroxylase-like [Lingula anatina]